MVQGVVPSAHVVLPRSPTPATAGSKHHSYPGRNQEFYRLVSLRVGESETQELAGVLNQLDTMGNIADLMVQMAFPEASVENVQAGRRLWHKH